MPKPLGHQSVYRSCGSAELKLKSSKEITPSYDFIAQERAVKAINLGLGIRRPGYNIYVSGYQGTGKTSVIKSFLEKWSKNAPPPSDWVYVHNFSHDEHPSVIELPNGEAKRLRKAMDHLVRDLKIEIPRILQSEEYEGAVTTYISASNERKGKLYAELEKLAKSLDFTVKSTRMGIETIPMIKGRPITEKEYAGLSDDQRNKIEHSRSKLEPEVLDFARKVRSIEIETREYLDTLRSDFGLSVVGSVIDPIMDHYEDKKIMSVVQYLKDVKEHILENLLDFVEQEEPSGEDEVEEFVPIEDRDPLKKYRVNVFVDNSTLKGAPVIIESNPTYYNLFGKIEKKVEYGVYQTDFSMIKSGSIHSANGGYLVLMANDIFRSGGAIWETLKRVLRSGQAFIEDYGEQQAMLATSGLRPQPVPLDIKVILIGNEETYHILFEDDEEFYKIFKIKAEFDFKMPRSPRNITSYFSFISSRAEKDKLLDFDRSALARIVEYGSRLVEDQNYVSTQFGKIKDLAIEADFIARSKGVKNIRREDIDDALTLKFDRNNLAEHQLLEMTQTGDILLSLTGSRIGVINALTVYELGDYSFGKACRITCTNSVSDEGVLNIERQVRLSGHSHDKGVLIISGLINSVLAKDKCLPLSASLCFEQSYGPIDGDSASMAELVAILSSMSGIPIRQNGAITGSVNQLGEAQSIGGVNEKIEGFYKTTTLIPCDQPAFVLIPKQNVSNLMLNQDVIEAVKNSEFLIYAIDNLWQAFELLTGVPLGIHSIYDESFAPGSALERIKDRIDKIYEEEDKLNKKRG